MAGGGFVAVLPNRRTWLDRALLSAAHCPALRPDQRSGSPCGAPMLLSVPVAEAFSLVAAPQPHGNCYHRCFDCQYSFSASACFLSSAFCSCCCRESCCAFCVS